MTQEQKTAVFKLTLESLTKDREEWMPWIKELTQEEMARLLVAILDQPWKLTEDHQTRDRLLILLGSFVTDRMQNWDWVEKWAPEILLARNRTLAARMPLPPE